MVDTPFWLNRYLLIINQDKLFPAEKQ